MSHEFARADETTAHYLIRLIEREGPISLGRFLGVANHDYYASRDPLGSEGDFTTAPEISQMFGELIGLWCADLWDRAGGSDTLQLVELGPGRGTLMADVLRAAKACAWDPVLHLVETSPKLRAIQSGVLPTAVHHKDISTLPDTGPMIVIANEFFDALPVEQLVHTADGWRQNRVGLERARFVLQSGHEPMEHLLGIDQRALPVGTIVEIHPAAAQIFEVLSRKIAALGGALLLIDYGYALPGSGSTLQAVRRHMPVNPLTEPGQADLTAHVNFAPLARAARKAGLSVHGPVEQGQWLTALGIEARMRTLTAAAPEKTDSIAANHRRLVHVTEMGRLFKVMAAVSSDWPEPAGFVYQD